MNRRSPIALRCCRSICGTAAVIAAALFLPAGAQPPRGDNRPLPDPAPDLSMDAMPDIDLDWPDLGADDPVIPPDIPVADVGSEPPADLSALPDLADDIQDRVASEADTAQAERLSAIDPAQPLRGDVRLVGIDAIADKAFRARFDALSELRKHDEPAILGQITRRAKADVDLVDKLMRVRGYYNARIAYLLRPDASAARRVDVDLEVRPGQLYRISDVVVTGLSAIDEREASIRQLFAVEIGDPADTDAILASADAVRTGLAEGGYPFAKVDDPVLRVDHDQRSAGVDMVVAPGGFRRFGAVRVTGNPPFDAGHVATIARFDPGDVYRQSEIVDLQRALVATGLVGSADIKPVQAATQSERVDLEVALTRAPPRPAGGAFGYGTGEGARAEVSWQHRNLFPPEGGLTVRGVLGVNEQSAGVAFRRNNFRARDRVLDVRATFSNVDLPAYQAVTGEIGATIERQTNIIFQKRWTWSLGASLILSDERDLYGQSQVPRQRTYLIGALPLSVTYDRTDDLLDPRTGFRLGARLSPELSLQDITFGYVRAQFDASAYVSPTGRLTFAGRARIGSIFGASADRIAPTRRYYAGGGGSVRGYSYQAIGPRDLNNEPVGGRSLSEFSLEARYRFGSANQFGIVPFIDAGTISPDASPTYRDMRYGAGLGFRYYSNFGPIRLDVGTPINPQPGDPRIGVYVSLGQAF